MISVWVSLHDLINFNETQRKTETAYNISLKTLPWQSKHKAITILSDNFQVKCIIIFVRLCLSPANPFSRKFNEWIFPRSGLAGEKQSLTKMICIWPGNYHIILYVGADLFSILFICLSVLAILVVSVATSNFLRWSFQELFLLSEASTPRPGLCYKCNLCKSFTLSKDNI